MAHLNAEVVKRADDLMGSLDDVRWLPKGTLEIPAPY